TKPRSNENHGPAFRHNPWSEFPCLASDVALVWRYRLLAATAHIIPRAVDGILKLVPRVRVACFPLTPRFRFHTIPIPSVIGFGHPQMVTVAVGGTILLPAIAAGSEATGIVAAPVRLVGLEQLVGHAGRALAALAAHLLHLDISAANGTAHGLGVFFHVLADDDLLDHASLFADDRFFVSFGHFNRAFPEGVDVYLGRRAINRATFNVHALRAQANLLFDRLRRDVAAYAHAAGFNLALANMQLFFNDVEVLLVMGHAGRGIKLALGMELVGRVRLRVRVVAGPAHIAPLLYAPVEIDRVVTVHDFLSAARLAFVGGNGHQRAATPQRLSIILGFVFRHTGVDQAGDDATDYRATGCADAGHRRGGKGSGRQHRPDTGDQGDAQTDQCADYRAKARPFSGAHVVLQCAFIIEVA